MSESPVEHVNHILLRRGFNLRKGDAGAVAKAADSMDEDAVVATALKLGLQPRESAAPGEPAGKEKEAALKWIVQRTKQLMDEPAVADNLARTIVNRAVDDSSRDEDGSPVLRDLSGYKTLGDFLEDIDDIDVDADMASELSGVAFASDWKINVFSDCMRDLVLRAMGEAQSREPSDISKWLQALDTKARNKLASQARDLLFSSEFSLGESVCDLPFDETVLRYRPETKERLENDIAAAAMFDRMEEAGRSRADEVASSIVASFGSRRLTGDRIVELGNAIVRHLRCNADVNVMMDFLLPHPTLRTILNKKARKAFEELAETWSQASDDFVNDFRHPLVKLFVALDDAWSKDGKPWHVSVIQGPYRASFSLDNWMFFLIFGLAGGVDRDEDHFGVVVRRFEEPSRLEEGLVSVGGLAIEGDKVMLLSAADVESAYAFDEHGNPLPKDLTMTYMDMPVLSPEFADAVKDASVFSDAVGQLRSFVDAALGSARKDSFTAQVFGDEDEVWVVLRTSAGVEIDRRSFATEDGFGEDFVAQVLSEVMSVSQTDWQEMAPASRDDGHGRFDGIKATVAPSGRVLH